MTVFMWLRNLGLNAKVALLGVSGVLVTAVALVVLAVWQSGEYNRLAQSEVDGLIDADLDHITRGVYQLVKTENDAVQHQVDYNLNVARHVLGNVGEIRLSTETVTWMAVNQFTDEPVVLQLPKMLVGDRWLGLNTEAAVETLVVDEVTRLVGETATIFQRINERGDMIRVATTVEDAHGKRAIGTFIPALNPDGNANPVIAAILSGETYHGRAFVVNAWYLTAYEPLKDSAGNLVGMLYVGVKHQTVEARVRQAILQTTVGKTGYVYVLGGKGKDRGRYIISQGGERDGEDIWETTDSDGHYVIQAIINKAIALNPGELATERYRWRNPDDTHSRWKVARLAYYEPWDWVIGTSTYEDELQSYRAFLTDGRFQMTQTMCLAGLGITLLIGMVGILLAWTVTRPIQQMTKAVETIIQGNLDQILSVRSRDEIGTLAEAFNVMTGRLNSTMEGLRRSEEKYRYIFENTIEGLFQTSLDGRFLSASPAMARILGYDSPEELMVEVTDLQRQVYVHSQDRDVILSAVLESGDVIEREVQLYRKDKQPIWVSLSIQAMRDDTGKVLFLHGFLTDITKRKGAEEELRRVTIFLDSIIENIPDMIFVKDAKDLRFMRFNRAGEELLGLSREDLLGKTDYDCFPKRQADFFVEKDRDVLRRNEIADIPEESVQTRNKGKRILHTKKVPIIGAKGEPDYLLGISEDITDRKFLEARLFQSQKMEAVGTLAGGIAHDFNNILAAIIGYTEIAKGKLQQRELHHHLEQVLKASERAKDLVSQILAFGRKADKEVKPVDISMLTKEALKLLRATLPSTIEIHFDNGSGLDEVFADPTQLHQIIMNLCTNAAHAMRGKGGVLEVDLSNVEIPWEMLPLLPDLKPGPYVKLRVSDTGTGIAPDIMGKIFDPFFTTKARGEGTGLGLSVVYGIVKECGGTVTVQSEPGRGSTFSVYLPAIEHRAELADEPSSNVPGGKERIIFVDDEDMLAEMGREMLDGLGYEVITATSSARALELFRTEPDRFDLIITDMTMPGMTGKELATELIGIRPSIPIILCTGYSELISEDEAKSMGIREFVIKPLNLRSIAELIRKVLDKKES